jgi:hypothetical protein
LKPSLHADLLRGAVDGVAGAGPRRG